MMQRVRKIENLPILVRKAILNRELIFRRIAAFLIDSLLFLLFTGVFLDPVLFSSFEEVISHFSRIFELHPWIFHPEHLPMIREIIYRTVAIYSHIFFAIYIFITLLEAYKGQTPGKYIMRIRVVKLSGEKIGIVESGIRNAGKIFLLSLDLILGIIIFSRKGFIRFFDYYTESTVELVT